jgi:hypothetical protein
MYAVFGQPSDISNNTLRTHVCIGHDSLSAGVNKFHLERSSGGAPLPSSSARPVLPHSLHQYTQIRPDARLYGQARVISPPGQIGKRRLGCAGHCQCYISCMSPPRSLAQISHDKGYADDVARGICLFGAAGSKFYSGCKLPAIPRTGRS